MAKKKAAHHGGAWKVAYADFVTAMMALFMVLWISSQDKKILIATSRYFQSPFRSPLEDHSGVMPFNKDQSSDSKQSDDDTTTTKGKVQDKAIEISFLNAVAADFYRMLNIQQDMQKKPIEVEVTSDGLRVTLFDRAAQPLFSETGSDFTPWGKFVMQNLAWLIDRHGFRVTIDGHTRSKLALTKPDYTAWELSADRANAARRVLVHYAVDADKIERVSGYADTRPFRDEPATSESNQRITLSLSLAPHRDDAAKPVPPPPRPSGSLAAAVPPSSQ